MKKIALILTVLVLFSSGCKFFGKKKEQEKAQIELAKQESIKKAAAVAAEQAKIEEQKKIAADQEASRLAEEERQRLYKFHVIVGSFKTPKYAAAYKDYISQKGYQTEILVNSYKFEMISIGSYKSWGDAVKDLQKAREAVEATSWIYIKGQ